MSNDSALDARADAIHERYRGGFVGRSRATRDIGLLDSIIADAEALASTVAADGGRAMLDENLALYRAERAEIAAIRAAGPDALAAWRLAEWSEVTYLRYLRAFAGQSRQTRDDALLGEMTDLQRGWVAAMKSLTASVTEPRIAAQVSRAAEHLATYETERAEIPLARGALPPGERARVLATLANGQFALYKVHFAGKARTSRRPGLMRRMITALEGIHAGMETTRSLGVVTEVHTKNLALVADRLGHHRGELMAIDAARGGAAATRVAGLLGEEANAAIAEYRAEFAGQSRATRDLAKLNAVCDQLQEIAHAMRELDAERPTPANTKNLGVVFEHLKVAEREFGAIREAKKQ